MILRKPYAILIKNFRLIHIILTLLAIFFFMKCNDMLSFLNSYISNTGMIIESYKIKELVPITLTLGLILFILFNIVIIVLMKMKKKNITFYIINIVYYIILFILFSYIMSTLTTMQTRIVDVRVVRALKDIFVAINLCGIISVLMYLTRAIGFDVKKFDFSKDLNEIVIEETDNEEFELSVDVDTNKIKRKRRKAIRMLKYFYFENKFICNCGLGLLLLVLSITIIKGILTRDPVFNQFDSFRVSGYTLEIGNVYSLNVDKNNEKIMKDKYFVIMEIKAKKNLDKKIKLNIGRLELEANGNSYYHNYNYKDYFSDIGTCYIDEDLTKEYQKFILIYRIDEKDAKKKMKLNYNDGANNTSIKINQKYLDVEKQIAFNLNEDVKIDNPILNNYQFKINKVQMDKSIVVDYKYSIKDETISAKEYIVPTFSSNYDKAILRIDYNFTLPNDYNSYATNTEQMFKKFGYINYEIDGKKYTNTFNLGTLKAVKVNQPNTIYFEIKEEILRADKVLLGIKIRNNSYEIAIKEGAK